jgi:hypothetical protein
MLIRSEEEGLKEMMRMWVVDAANERRRQRVGRILVGIVFALAIVYGYFVSRACMDVDGCTAAMAKYDGFVP